MSDTQDNQPIKGKTFSETYTTEEGRIPVGTEIHQPVFWLTEADWAYFKHGEPRIYTYARSILIGGILASFLPVAKIISWLTFPEPTRAPILLWEWVAPAIAICIAVLLFIIGRFTTNPSKRVKKEIDAYFDKGRK